MKRFLTISAMALLAMSAFAQQKAGSSAAASKSNLVDTAAMDTTADPCVDFYQYSCGGWRKANPVPPDRTSWNRYGEMAERNRALMHDILEEVSKPGAKRDAVSAQVGDYYAACMDEATINAAGKKPIEA